MKRVISIVLIAILCGVMFVSCSGVNTATKAPVDSENIVGKWAFSLDAEVMSNIASSSSDENQAKVMEFIFDPSFDSSVDVYYTFNADGTGKVECDAEEIGDFMTGMLDHLVDRLKNNKSLLVEMMNSTSGTEYSVEEYEELLADQGMSWDGLISYLETGLDAIVDPMVDEAVKSIQGDTDFEYEINDGVFMFKNMSSTMINGKSKLNAYVEGDTLTLEPLDDEDAFSLTFTRCN